jgi:type III secretion protein V
MKNALSSLAALPLRELGRRPDVVLALGVSFIVGMLIVPLPLFMLDSLIAVNIAGGVVILLVALFARRALDVSSFPTLLLVTTLFRLGLNISTTRNILAKGDGGEVVEAFGHFVLQGDIVVGSVIFLVLTLVQFMVIAKGSERVAEVGARFTLDAMPGKQMAIDAALRAGAFDDKEAERRRHELARESQLFGNMDGAMKFVKGDAIAGLIITAINFIAGIIIGVVRNGMSASDALDTYSLLAVGDGLVSQIPALLITLSSGILVTRVAAAENDSNLGATVKDELLGNSKVLYIAGGLMFALGLIPGLPLFPFWLLGTFAFITAAAARMLEKKKPEATALEQKKQLASRVERAKAQKAAADHLAPSVVPLTIDLDVVLTEALGFNSGEDNTDLVNVLIPQLRDALYLETGVRFPGVRVRTSVGGLPESSFCVRVNDVPACIETFPADQFLATTAPESLRRLGIIAREGKNPVNSTPVSILTRAQKEVAEASGIKVWSASGAIALYMAGVLRKKAKHFIGFQEVSEMVERLEKIFPALVKEVVPKIVSISQLVEVLRRLVDEGVSIRDLKSIVQALGENGTADDDVLFLTERARYSLSSQIAYGHAGIANRLPVVLLDPVIEDTIAAAITSVKGGKIVSLEPTVCRELIMAVAQSLLPSLETGTRPVILTNSEIRRYVRKLIENELPDVAVLSFEELPSDLTVQPTARATLSAA